MRYPTPRFVFDRKHTATKKTKGSVQIEILFNKKRKWIGTGVRLYADQWSEKTKARNCSNFISINEKLDMQMEDINVFIREIARKKMPFSFDALDRYLNLGYISENFLEFVERRIDERQDLREGTVKTHRSLLNSLQEFGRIYSFADITKANISLYDDFLHGHGYEQTTVYGYHKRLKRYINEAIRYDMLKDNPYSHIKIERGKSSGIKYLKIEEVKKIRSAVIPIESIERARDLFVFQCFTGMSYADMFKFDFKNVVEEKGKYVIRDERVKTEEEYFIVLLSPAVEILKKYNYSLPKLSNFQYNQKLKIVADYAKINKSLTSHMGRHSFAVLALNLGVKIENLAKMMGHTDIKTTQIYAKVLNESVKSEFEMLEKAIRTKIDK
jgi:integrase/recombinase XerD